MSANKMLLCNGLVVLLLAKMLRTSPLNIKPSKPTTLFTKKQRCTEKTPFPLSDTGLVVRIKGSSPFTSLFSAFESLMEEQSKEFSENTQVSVKPTFKEPLVIGTKMQLSFVKIAIPGCPDLLAPLSKCNSEVIFTAAVPGGRMLPWAFNYVSESQAVYEDPELEKNLPECHVNGETSAERSVRFDKHQVECAEYHFASEAQEHLSFMLKEAMEDDMFSQPHFPKFLEFPSEIQCLIWNLVAKEERIIEAHITKRCAEWIIMYASTDVKNPAILSVCQLARVEGLKQYKELTIENSWKRDKKMYDERIEERNVLGLGPDHPFIGPEASTTNFRCYINYDVDTIFINTEHSRIYRDALPHGMDTWREDFGYQFLKDVFFSPAGDQIKNLAIDYRLAEKWLNTGRKNWTFCQVLAAMPLLNKLTIVWADHKGLEGTIEKECCSVGTVKIEPLRELSHEERYHIKFPCGGFHRRVKEFKEMENAAVDAGGETCAIEDFASGKTSSVWRNNIMAAIREHRPRNPSAYKPDSFHFLEGGKSRYRDLDDLELSQVHVKREKN
ncbi:hypothetical protein NHQ30_004578 [Ciborinia camelliae]|nr:hypothetical protein NHQ30_004578 [Ciborinia camelliae]